MNIEEVRYMRVVYMFQENYHPAAFALEIIKTKTRFADVFKARKQEITYRKGIYRLQRKKPLTSHKYPVQNARNTEPVMSLENETSQVGYD